MERPTQCMHVLEYILPGTHNKGDPDQKRGYSSGYSEVTTISQTLVSLLPLTEYPGLQLKLATV